MIFLVNIRSTYVLCSFQEKPEVDMSTSEKRSSIPKGKSMEEVITPFLFVSSNIIYIFTLAINYYVVLSVDVRSFRLYT